MHNFYQGLELERTSNNPESSFLGQTNGPPPSPSQSVSGMSFPLNRNKQSWKEFSIAILDKGNPTFAWQYQLTAKDRSWLF